MRVVQFKKNKKNNKGSWKKEIRKDQKVTAVGRTEEDKWYPKDRKTKDRETKNSSGFQNHFFFFSLIIRSNGEHLKRWKKKETNKVQKGIYQKSETYYERHISIFNVNNRRITKGWIEKTCTRHWGGLVIQCPRDESILFCNLFRLEIWYLIASNKWLKIIIFSCVAYLNLVATSFSSANQESCNEDSPSFPINGIFWFSYSPSGKFPVSPPPFLSNFFIHIR